MFGAPPKPGSYIPPWLVPIPVNTRDVADVLRRLLDPMEPRLARWVYSTHNAQAAALKYQEIRNAIRDGDLSEAVLERWRQDYARMVADKLDPYRQALYRAVDKTVDPALVLVPTSQAVADANRLRNMALIKNVTEQQRDAVRALLAYNAHLEPPLTVEGFAKVLRPCIGLTEREAKAVARWRDQLGVEGYAGAATEHSVQNYAAFLLRRRADRIARTELSWSFNAGQLATIKNAQTQGVLVTEVRKRWAAAMDEMTCPVCGGELDGQVVGLDADFSTGVPHPPAHPHCRCGVIYEAQRA